MVFSVTERMLSGTDRMLSGSRCQPDVVTIQKNRCTFNGWKENFTSSYRANKLDQNGHRFLVSSCTGSLRILLGIAHTIGHLVPLVLGQDKQRNTHEVKRGIKNAGIGMIEIVPVIGNIAMVLIHRKQEYKIDQLVKKQAEDAKYENSAILFHDGKRVGQRPTYEYEYKLQGFKNPKWYNKQDIILYRV